MEVLQTSALTTWPRRQASLSNVSGGARQVSVREGQRVGLLGQFLASLEDGASPRWGVGSEGGQKTCFRCVLQRSCPMVVPTVFLAKGVENFEGGKCTELLGHKMNGGFWECLVDAIEVPPRIA